MERVDVCVVGGGMGDLAAQPDNQRCPIRASRIFAGEHTRRCEYGVGAALESAERVVAENLHLVTIGPTPLARRRYPVSPSRVTPLHSVGLALAAGARESEACVAREATGAALS